MGDIDRWHLELHTFFHRLGKQWGKATAKHSSYVSFAWKKTAKGCWTKQELPEEKRKVSCTETVVWVHTSALVCKRRCLPTDCLITVVTGAQLRQQLVVLCFLIGVYSEFWSPWVTVWKDGNILGRSAEILEGTNKAQVKSLVSQHWLWLSQIIANSYPPLLRQVSSNLHGFSAPWWAEGTPCGGETITRNSLCHTERDEIGLQRSL